LLVAAFSGSRGTVSTPAQARFLRALVDRPDLWDPAFSAVGGSFLQAGFPYDRAECERRLVASGLEP
jgi:hypothetical protein